MQFLTNTDICFPSTVLGYSSVKTKVSTEEGVESETSKDETYVEIKQPGNQSSEKATQNDKNCLLFENGGILVDRYSQYLTGKVLYKCYMCTKAFRKADMFERHIKRHRGENPYNCNLCGRSFKGAKYLKSHHRTHMGEKPYKCDICT